jgi:hypothetical protein
LLSTLSPCAKNYDSFISYHKRYKEAALTCEHVARKYTVSRMAGKPEKGFKIEYSKSNRAGCKGCGQKIEKDSLRLGRMMPSPHFDGFVSCRSLARLSRPVYNSKNCEVIIVGWLISACLRADAIVCYRHNLPAFVVILAGAALGTSHFHSSLSRQTLSLILL